jgi:hypothetical protein
MLKLFCSYDYVRFILLKIWTEWVINCYILCHFSISNHVYYHCRSRSRIALRLRLRPNDAAPCGSGSSSATLAATVKVQIKIVIANVSEPHRLRIPTRLRPWKGPMMLQRLRHRLLYFGVHSISENFKKLRFYTAPAREIMRLLNCGSGTASTCGVW